MALKGIKPKYQVASDGFVLPMGFPIESYYSGLQYKAQLDDVFVVTYPKCGTTWCQYILLLLKHQGCQIPKGKRLGDYSPHLEEMGKEAVEKMDPPRIIKCHLPRHLTPFNKCAKYIYIARNPKDCCVSFYHHTVGFPHHYDFHKGSFSDFFELFIKGEIDFGDYFDHLLSWHEHRNDLNVLFLLYEDMKMDLRAIVKKIGNFLGGIFRESASSDEIMDDVLRKSGIEAMGSVDEAFWSSKRAEDVPKFIRKGAVGDWKNNFSEEQTARMDMRFQEKLGKTSAIDLWKSYDC